ncbi:MAG TPA: FmdB family zinc ribbon protein [Dermatophilaceae bacterium]|nr:FmdB family zinc ribbon protein [Dermatophilaceae bacterium]
MPTYAYACTECSHRFDIVQAFTDDSLTVCPACGGRLRKMFNAVGVVFKGSGFYRTDSRAANGDTSPKEPSPAKNGDSPAAASADKASNGSKATSRSNGAGGSKAGGGSNGDGAGKATPAKSAGSAA